jgi:hypothetical protein
MLTTSYGVAAFMNWGLTAPTYPTNVSYTSSGAWQNIKVIDYSPSHYPDFNWVQLPLPQAFSCLFERNGPISGH